MSAPHPSSLQKKKYLDPTLHFIKKRITVGGPDSTDKAVISEIVRPGQLLLNFPELKKYADRGFEPSPILAGAHTCLAEDGASLTATTFGYPRIELVQDEVEQPVYHVALTPLFKISPDKMSATLVIHPLLPGHPSPLVDDLPQLLTDAGITYGLDEQALSQVAKTLQDSPTVYSNTIVAHGTPSGEGTDARLHFEIEIGPLAGRMLDNGDIDYRDRKIMVGVHEGEIIATKIPPIAGTAGINVFGEQVEPKFGQDIKIKLSSDVAFSEETLKVTATRNGVLSIINNDTIKVCAKQKIAGDIDFKTGNIESKNAVEILGDVQPGFKVTTAGDLKICGGVMSAAISCQSNVVIKGGITGKKSTISAAGDADIYFIEQGRLTSGGIVVVRKQSYYSSITATSDIRFATSATLMGGTVIAGGNLTLGDVGSPNSEAGLIGAGVDPERLTLYQQLLQQHRQQQDDLIQWLQRVGGRRSKKIRQMEAKIDETKMSLLKLNLIPGTELYSRVGAKTAATNVDEDVYHYTTGINIQDIRIDVHGTIHAGTKILLGNRSILLEKTISRRQFKLSKNLKGIIAAPLGR